MQTSDSASTIKYTERVLKILNTNYDKDQLEQVAADPTQLNPEEIIMHLGILNKFDGLFDGDIEKWDT